MVKKDIIDKYANTIADIFKNVKLLLPYIYYLYNIKISNSLKNLIGG